MTYFNTSKSSHLSSRPGYTPKNAQVVTSLLLLKLLQQADIRMRSHGLRQLVDNKSVASCLQTCCKLIIITCYQQACCKLLQQVVTSLRMTSCSKPDFNNLCFNLMKLTSLLWLVDKNTLPVDIRDTTKSVPSFKTLLRKHYIDLTSSIFNPDDPRTLKSVCVKCHTSRPLWNLLSRPCC